MRNCEEQGLAVMVHDKAFWETGELDHTMKAILVRKKSTSGSGTSIEPSPIV